MAPDRPDAVDQLFGGLGDAGRAGGRGRTEAGRDEEPPEEPRRGRGRPKGKPSSMLHLYVSDELRDRLKAASAATGVSCSKLAEEWLAPHLEEYADLAEALASRRRKRAPGDGAPGD